MRKYSVSLLVKDELNCTDLENPMLIHHVHRVTKESDDPFIGLLGKL